MNWNKQTQMMQFAEQQFLFITIPSIPLMNFVSDVYFCCCGRKDLIAYPSFQKIVFDFVPSIIFTSFN